MRRLFEATRLLLDCIHQAIKDGVCRECGAYRSERLGEWIAPRWVALLGDEIGKLRSPIGELRLQLLCSVWELVEAAGEEDLRSALSAVSWVGPVGGAPD